jgi:ribosomal protein S18 acetylase RimI-like enzyme
MIRPIAPADSAAVVALAVSSGLFPEEETGFLDRMLAEYFASKIEEGHVCLINEEDRPLGVAYYAPEIVTDRTWNLLMIAVRGDCQGLGHGTTLLRYVENTLRGASQRMLLVETSGLPGFERTRAFYAKCGYEAEARIRDYYSAGEDKIIFRKVLNTE